MQRNRVLLALLVVCLVPVLKAQTTAPQPDPAMKKLNVLIGHWTYEGKYLPGPLGLVGKVKGVWNVRPILSGFFLHEDVYEKVGAGGARVGISRAFGIEYYDPTRKRFITNWYQSDGSTYSGTLSIAGNTVVWAGPMEFAGKHYRFQEIFTCAPDFMSGTSKREFSTDGRTWTTFWQAKLVKTGPVAKQRQ